MSSIQLLNKILSRYFFDPGEFEKEDFLYANGKFSDSLFYSILFMPELVKIEGHIFLNWKLKKIGLPEELKELLGKSNGNLSTLEEQINCLEMNKIFQKSSKMLLDEEKILAERTRNAWDGWLRIKYPNRKFVVKVKEKTEEKGYIVCFYEKRI